MAAPINPRRSRRRRERAGKVEVDIIVRPSG
jgi:hypothetical protein